MKVESTARNRRILIVDDSPAIHDDFKKILVRRNPAGDDFASAETSLFGPPPETGAGNDQDFELASAFQGEEARRHPHVHERHRKGAAGRADAAGLGRH